MKRWIVTVSVLLLSLAALGYGLYAFTPWPKALLIRQAFDKDGEAKARALARHVSAGVAHTLDVTYLAGDGDAKLDVFRPADASTALPAIVWIHGGGWISGSKEQVSNYLRILAAHGYVAVGIDYSLAPERHYPLPVAQANQALGYLAENAARFGIDPQRLVLAGDSAGAQIAAQVANLVTDTTYARAMRIDPAIAPGQLKAVVLACGAYDLALADTPGDGGDLIRTFLWAYTGRRDYRNAAYMDEFSVAEHVTAGFPPSFFTAGNGDPLAAQSLALSERLAGLGVDVDTLFYPADHSPALPHEYQFNLDNDDGRQALARILAFVDKRVETGHTATP